MKITSKTDTLDLRNKLKMYAEIVGVDSAEALRRHARIAVLDMCNLMAPFSRGNKAKAKALGERAVQRDILEVFYPATGGRFRAQATRIARRYYSRTGAKNPEAQAEKFKDRFLAYQMSENTQALAGIAADMKYRRALFDTFNPRYHREQRNAKGRVVKPQPVLIIGAERQLEKYIETSKKKVGLTKAGFALVAQKIPTKNSGDPLKGVPAWVKRHVGRASGRMQDHTRGGLLNRNIRVVMTNATPWASNTITNQQVNGSLQSTRRKFIKYMNAQIRYELKRRAGLK